MSQFFAHGVLCSGPSHPRRLSGLAYCAMSVPSASLMVTVVASHLSWLLLVTTRRESLG